MTTKKKRMIVGILLVLLAGVLCYLNFDNIKNVSYLSKGNVTNEVAKDTMDYLKQEEKDYLVLFYSKKKCDTCSDYLVELKKYESAEHALPLYKVNTDKLTEEQVNNELFIDNTYPTIVHIKAGAENYRHVGHHSINTLPNEQTKDVDTMLTPDDTKEEVEETTTESPDAEETTN